MIDLRAKHAVVFGVASEDSLAWAIARTLQRAGASISLGYQQRFKSRVWQLVRAGQVPVAFYDRCDVTRPEELSEFFSKVPGQIDVVVHSIAFADPETFSRPISELGQEHFTESLITSSYSLIPLTRAALPRMGGGGSVIAMSYLGGQRVVANYKLMGIAKAALEAGVRELAADVGPQGVRVNAISAGPIKTLAASQIAGFDELLACYQQVAPMRRRITQDDVANLAAFLASDLSRNITGQTVFVDGGYSIMAAADALPARALARGRAA